MAKLLQSCLGSLHLLFPLFFYFRSFHLTAHEIFSCTCRHMCFVLFCVLFFGHFPSYPTAQCIHDSNESNCLTKRLIEFTVFIKYFQPFVLLFSFRMNWIVRVHWRRPNSKNTVVCSTFIIRSNHRTHNPKDITVTCQVPIQRRPHHFSIGEFNQVFFHSKRQLLLTPFYCFDILTENSVHFVSLKLTGKIELKIPCICWVNRCVITFCRRRHQ